MRVLPAGHVTHARVFAVTGACCLIRRNVFALVDGFDEAFVNGCEDVDLCLKVKAQGLHIYMAYHSVVQHHVSLSRSGTSLQNERNSRLLFQKWRPQIKREAAQVWQQGLCGNAAAPMNNAPVELGELGELAPTFAATPFAAAQVLSESALMREEARWARLLDKTDPNAGLESHCHATGLVRSTDDTHFVLCSPLLQVNIACSHGLDGFYLSGNQTNPPAGVQTRVTIAFNGLQSKTFTLGPEQHFNVGISQPVVLRGITNTVEAVFSSHHPAGHAASTAPADPCRYITLAHLVIDGKQVTSFAVT